MIINFQIIPLWDIPVNSMVVIKHFDKIQILLFFILFNIIMQNNLVSCQLLIHNNYDRNIRRQDLINDNVGSGNLFVGEVSSEAEITATGTGKDIIYDKNHPNNGNLYNINKNDQIYNNNNGNLPYDIITFSNRKPQIEENYNGNLGNDEHKSNKEKRNKDYTEVIYRNNIKTQNDENTGIYDNLNKNNNGNKNEIIGTNNLIKFVNDHIEQDVLKSLPGGYNNHSPITPRPIKNNQNFYSSSFTPSTIQNYNHYNKNPFTTINYNNENIVTPNPRQNYNTNPVSLNAQSNYNNYIENPVITSTIQNYNYNEQPVITTTTTPLLKYYENNHNLNNIPIMTKTYNNHKDNLKHNSQSFSWYPGDKNFEQTNNNGKLKFWYPYYNPNTNHKNNINKQPFVGDDITKNNYDQFLLTPVNNEGSIQSDHEDNRYDNNNNPSNVDVNNEKVIYYPQEVYNDKEIITSDAENTAKVIGNKEEQEEIEEEKYKEGGEEVEQNEEYNQDKKDDDNNNDSKKDSWITPNRVEQFEGDSDNEPYQPPPKDLDEERVRNFVSEHEVPREIPTRLNYPGGGLWGRPSLDSGIKLDFIPQQTYSQTRRSSTVKFLPQEEAFAAASTPEEIINAPRLREVISHKKTQEVYEEEGYEDTAYDHGGYKKGGAHAENTAKDSSALIPEDEIVEVPDQAGALKEHEKYVPKPSGDSDHETQGSGQRKIIQRNTPYGTPSVRTWKSEKTTSNEKSLTFLDHQGKSNVHIEKPKPQTEGTVGRSIEYSNAKGTKEIIDEKAHLIPDTLSQHSNPSGHSIKLPSINIGNHRSETTESSGHRNTDYNNPDQTKYKNLNYNIDPRNSRTRNSERLKERQNAYSISNRKQKINRELRPSESNSQGEQVPEEQEEIDPNHPHSFYSGSFVYNKAKMIKLDKSGLPVDATLVSEYDDDEGAEESNEGVENKDRNKQNSQDEEYQDYDGVNNSKKVQSSTRKSTNSRNISPNRTLKNSRKDSRNSNERAKEEIKASHQSHERNRPIVNEDYVTPVTTVTESGTPIGILTQWRTPIIGPSSYEVNEKYSTLTKRHPIVHDKINHKDDSLSTQAESSMKIDSLTFPTWNGESSIFKSIPEKINLENFNLQTESSLTNKNINKNYKIIPRQRTQLVKPSDTDTYQTEWRPIVKESNIRHPFLSKDDKKLALTDNEQSQSKNIEFKEQLQHINNKKINSTSSNSPTSSIKHVEQLTLAHYSNPGNILLYKPESIVKQNRLKYLADELNKSVESKKESNKSTFLKRKKRYTESEAIEKENREEEGEEDEEKSNDSENNNEGDDYNNDEETSIENYESNENVQSNVELVNIEVGGTTTEIPVDTNKYPFYKMVPSDILSKYSPLRYAMSPQYIPKKTGRGMEFYESRDHIECEEPSPPKVVPQRNKDGEWNAKPVPDGSRLKGLGDKIKCLRMKYFGRDPLDNPFFKEETVSVPKIFASDRKSDNIEDQLGLYVDIMSNIKANVEQGNIQPESSRVKIIQTRPTRNITYNLNDKFKGYGKKYHNGFKPYYGKQNKYSSSYKNIGGQRYIKQKFNRGENKFNDNKNSQHDTESSSTTSNALLNQQNQWNNYNNKNKDENFDSFIPSYLPIKDDTVSIVENVENHYNNACKHYEYLLKPLMSLVPPPPTSPQTIVDDKRKKRKSTKPVLYPTSIYSVLNSKDEKKKIKPNNKRPRYVRGNKLNVRPPYRFSYALKPNNNKYSTIKKNPLIEDNTASGSVYHTMVTIKELPDQTNQVKRLNNKHIHQYYTVIKRPKRELKQNIKPKIVLNYDNTESSHKVIKRIKRNLNIDPYSKPILDLPFNFNNKYHKIISRDDRNMDNSSTTTTATTEVNKDITDDDNKRNVRPRRINNFSTNTPRAVKKLSQELTIILNVHDNNNTNNDNDRPQRRVSFIQRSSNREKNPNGSSDTIFSSSRKIESTSKTEPTDIYSTNNEELKSAGHVSRLSGGFISRHSPVYSSKYSKNLGIKNENDIGTTLSSTTNIETSTNSESEKTNGNENIPEENYPTVDTITTTTAGRLKVRFPKLTAKPTVAIVPEDHIKTKSKSSNKNATRVLTTSTTTTTTEPAPTTTTRMYKPKRVYKKEHNPSKIVDAFAVLNRQRDGSSEKNIIQTTSTPSSTGIDGFDDTTVTTTAPMTSTKFEIKELSTRKSRQKLSPRNFQVEHRRISKEEVIKRTYSDDKDDSREGDADDSRELADHPDLRDPTARMGRVNIEEEREEQIGASSSNQDEVINETLMYVVDPKTGFGRWEAEPNLQKIIRSAGPPSPRSRYSKNHNHKGNYRYRDRSKSRYSYNDPSLSRQSKDRSNNADINTAVTENESYKVLSRTPSTLRTIPVTEDEFSVSTTKSYQRDPSNYGRPIRRHRVKVHKNKINSVTPVDKEVYLVENLMTQVAPYPTTTPLPALFEDGNDYFNIRKKETSTAKIILEPDKRMYYYLPE